MSTPSSTCFFEKIRGLGGLGDLDLRPRRSLSRSLLRPRDSPAAGGGGGGLPLRSSDSPWANEQAFPRVHRPSFQYTQICVFLFKVNFGSEESGTLPAPTAAAGGGAGTGTRPGTGTPLAPIVGPPTAAPFPPDATTDPRPAGGFTPGTRIWIATP